MTDNTPAITESEVIEFVAGFLADRGHEGMEIAADTPLESLGLDSISLVELLLAAREELTESGRLPQGVTLTNMPVLEHVSDLAELFRELAAQPA